MVSDAAWETLSNQAVAAAGLVYFLALLVHLAEWAALRQPAAKEPGRAWCRAGGAAPRGRRGRRRRASYAGGAGRVPRPARLPADLHRGRRPPRGAGRARDGRGPEPGAVGQHVRVHAVGHVRGDADVLVLYRRFALDWMAPIVVGFVLTVLMVAVIWLHEPVAPLTEALNSYWLVIHVVSAVIATGAFTLGGITSLMYLVKMRAGDEATGWLGRVPGPRRRWTGSPTGCTRSRSRCGPSRCSSPARSGRTRRGRATGTGTPRRCGRSSPGWSTPATSTPAPPPAGRAATPRSSRWSAWPRCGSTSSGSTTSRRPASTRTPIERAGRPRPVESLGR